MTDFQFFKITADSAIICLERNVSMVLALRGINRSMWPKPWPLVADNPHGTLNPVILRIALASMDDVNGQHESFARGWCNWLDQCPNPLVTPEEVMHRCQR